MWFVMLYRYLLSDSVRVRSWRQDSRPVTFFQINTCGHSSHVTSPLKTGCVCRLQLMLALVRAVILRSEYRGTHNHILLSQIWDSTNLEGQVPVFISPRDKVAQLYPQALGSLFFTSYDSQGYGGGIRPSLHTGILSDRHLPLYACI
jgi:hypothetical protein